MNVGPHDFRQVSNSVRIDRRNFLVSTEVTILAPDRSAGMILPERKPTSDTGPKELSVKFPIQPKPLRSWKHHPTLRMIATKAGQLGFRKTGASVEEIEESLGGYDPGKPVKHRKISLKSRTIGGEQGGQAKTPTGTRRVLKTRIRSIVRRDESSMDRLIYLIVLVPMLVILYFVGSWLFMGHPRVH